MTTSILSIARQIMHSPIHNYAIPGLTSWVVGKPRNGGMIRLFHSTRNHQEPICPHSHRFDLKSTVLQGSVTNLLWQRSAASARADFYVTTRLTYSGTPGVYKREREESALWVSMETRYTEGESYFMEADEVHSIRFAKDTWVLIEESPEVIDHSIMLEPLVDGEVIPLGETAPWMFKRG